MTAARFSGDVMRLCRQFHGLSQADLGNKIGLSRQYVHQLELGEKIPNELTLRAIASALSVDVSYLTSVASSTILDEDCHFRKLKTTPKWLINQTQAYGKFFEVLLGFVEKHLRLPTVNFPQLNAHTNDAIENAAEEARDYWGLTKTQPIKNMVRVLENAGAVVVSFDSVSDKLDALSIHRRRPIVIRSIVKSSPTRLRFDIAHECGHLVLHKGIVTGDHKTEAQADRFASAFLLPRSAFINEFPKSYRISWEKLFALKRRWNVSIQAIVRRAFDLGLFDASQYKRACVYIAKTGQKKGELHEPEYMEAGEVFYSAMSALRTHYGFGVNELEKATGLKSDALRKLVGEDVWELLQVTPKQNVINLRH